MLSDDAKSAPGNAGRGISPRGAHWSASKKKVVVKTAIAPFSFFFSILYSGRHAAHGIQSRPAKLPEFIPDNRRRGERKERERERGEGVKEREWSASLIHAGARVIPRPRHILTSFRVTLCFSKMVGAHVAARQRRGGWFISNTQSHPPSHFLSLFLSF